jgi:hypothetical protein
VAVDEEPQRASELVVVAEVVDAVVIVQRLTQLRLKLLPVRVGNAERRRPNVLQAADEPPPVRREVRREEDDVYGLLRSCGADPL